MTPTPLNYFQLTLDHLKAAPLPSLAATHGKTILQIVHTGCSAYIVFTDASWIEFCGYDGLTTGYIDSPMIQARSLPDAMLRQQLIDAQTHAEWAEYHRVEDKEARQRYLTSLRTQLAEAEAAERSASTATGCAKGTDCAISTGYCTACCS